MAGVRLVAPLLGSSMHAVGADAPVLAAGERQAVREHLDCVLLSPVFRNSRRYSGFLRYVVEAALNGSSDHLKERTIGIEVFGRAPDYDSATDHCVRSAAGEVRKRLAQYYMESGADCALRIELHPGSYAPQLRFPETKRVMNSGNGLTEPSAIAPAGDQATLGEAGVAGVGRVAHRIPMRLTAAIAIAALPVLGFTYWSVRNRPTPFQQLWSPLLSYRGPTLICIGGGSESSVPGTTPPPTMRDLAQSPLRHMSLGDAMTLAGLTGMLQANGKQYRILNRASATSFEDLQQAPFILVGAWNNIWTLRLMTGLRFTFARGQSGAYIADTRNPDSTAWSFNSSAPSNQTNRDYAIVSRLWDPKTEQPVMIVSGISGWGTQAAGEFVTSPSHLKELEALAPRNWVKKNLQVVIATDVIEGSPGPPMIVAANFW
jgi:hypothetical protein